ncbi:alpha/beta hydrolase [Lentzea sp. NPDC058436]|uniref:alpha/beta hydrolase n=1 Tax=Lentzea sp. NPDC058436 TaxID=3346499 RepID=UPI00366297A1
MTTIVLIHGTCLTARCWDGWARHLRDRGFDVLAPAWPGLSSDVEALRADPAPLAGLGIATILDHHESIVRGLGEPPVIIGHSTGATIAQLLLGRGLGAAGIALAPAPTKGLHTLPLAAMTAAWPGLRDPRNVHGVVELDAEQFWYRYANTLSEEESARAYERHYVPASGRVLFESAFANFGEDSVTEVDLGRAPLLVVSGGRDHLSPPSLGLASVRRRRASGALTGYRELAGRGHLMITEPGWEEVADHAVEWVRAALDAESAQAA